MEIHNAYICGCLPVVSSVSFNLSLAAVDPNLVPVGLEAKKAAVFCKSLFVLSVP